MSSNVTRAFAILELLAAKEEPMALQDIAEALAIPPSAAHRHLVELNDLGYVMQNTRQGGGYSATTKIVTLGFTVLSARGIVDLAQPVLDRLAALSGELVRLAVRDGERLTFVARSQGARGGLIYDGDMGREPVLFASATGMAWLSCMSDDDAVRLIVKQGLGPPNPIASGTPKSMKDVLDRLAETRERGWGLVIDSADAGITAIAAAVRDRGGDVLGTVSIAGPTIRLTAARVQELAGSLKEAARQIATLQMGSPAMRPGRGWMLADDPRQAIDGQAPAPATSR